MLWTRIRNILAWLRGENSVGSSPLFFLSSYLGLIQLQLPHGTCFFDLIIVHSIFVLAVIKKVLENIHINLEIFLFAVSEFRQMQVISYSADFKGRIRPDQNWETGSRSRSTTGDSANAPENVFYSEIFFCDEVVQSVVQRPEVQELVQESGLVHTCTSLLRDQRLWYLVGIRHCGTATKCSIKQRLCHLT
jgi:hypothetical protein